MMNQSKLRKKWRRKKNENDGEIVMMDNFADSMPAGMVEMRMTDPGWSTEAD